MSKFKVRVTATEVVELDTEDYPNDDYDVDDEDSDAFMSEDDIIKFSLQSCHDGDWEWGDPTFTVVKVS